MAHVASLSAAIHIVAHACNLERYHQGQSAEARGLLAALSKLGDTSNESYLNPIRTFHTVSSCTLPTSSSEKHVLFRSLLQSRTLYSKSFS